MIFGKRRGSRDPVGQVVSIEGQDMAIIDLGREVSSVLVPDIERNILTHGKPFESGGLVGIRVPSNPRRGLSRCLVVARWQCFSWQQLTLPP